MPKYKVERNGEVYQVESPTELTDEQVVAQLPSAPGMTLMGTAKGFGKQLGEDAKGLVDTLRKPKFDFSSQQEAKDYLHSIFSLKGAKEMTVLPESNPAERGGRTAARIAEFAAPFMMKGLGGAKAVEEPLRPGTPGVPQRLSAPKSNKLNLPSQVATAPPSYLTEHPVTRGLIERTGEPPITSVSNETQYPIGVKTRFKPKPAPKASYADTMKSVENPVEFHSGAEPGSLEAKQANTLHRETAEMDRGFKDRLADPKGAINPKLLKTLAGATAGTALTYPPDKEHPVAAGLVGALLGAAAANPVAMGRLWRDARTTSLLSGLAPAKSALGNLGAIGNASLLSGSAKPILEALRLPENTKNFLQAWKSGANPSDVPSFKRFNLPGRLMGAADQTTQQILERGGLSEAQGKNLLLTENNNAAAAMGLKNPVGEYIVPFQKTNFNQLKGIENIAGANKNFPRGKQMALAAGYGGAGYLAGKQTNNPVLIGLLSSLGGPFGAPFLLGAAGSAGPRIAESLSPISGWTLGRDLYDPFRWITNPGFSRFLNAPAAPNGQ